MKVASTAALFSSIIWLGFSSAPAQLLTIPSKASAEACGRQSLMARLHTREVHVEYGTLAKRDKAFISVCDTGRLIARWSVDAAKQVEVQDAADLNADGLKDLHLYSWSGGAHCCITHLMVVDQAGTRPPVLLKYYQGHGEAAQFESVQGYGRPVLRVPETGTAGRYSIYAASPILPVVVEIEGTRLRLSSAFMHSNAPGLGPAVITEGPPQFREFVQKGMSAWASPGIPSPSVRITEIQQGLAYAKVEAERTGRNLNLVLRAQGVLSKIDSHVKVYCLYDRVCDLPSLIAQAVGANNVEGLRPFTAELKRAWKSSAAAKLAATSLRQHD
jgi:hypothetical protein